MLKLEINEIASYIGMLLVLKAQVNEPEKERSVYKLVKIPKDEFYDVQYVGHVDKVKNGIFDIGYTYGDNRADMFIPY